MLSLNILLHKYIKYMVMGLLLKLFFTGQIKIKEGTLSLSDIYLNVLPASVLATLNEYFLLKNELWKFYAMMWLNGFIVVKKIDELYNLKKSDEIYSFGMDFGEAIGLGLYKTHEYFPSRYTYFKIMPNPYHNYYFTKHHEPIDYFVAGVMGGGGCETHKSVCQCLELKCINQGYKYCEFLTATEEELKRRNLWKIAEKRYNLDKIYPIQKKIYHKFDKLGIKGSLELLLRSLK